MDAEFIGDFRCVIRSFMLYQKAKEEEVKKKRFENFKNMAECFEIKWNMITHKNYKFSEWVSFVGRRQNEEIYKRNGR